MNLFIKSVVLTPGITRFYVADDAGRKVFPAAGTTDRSQCEDYISGGPGSISWIEFNILAEVNSLAALDPDHHLVKAVRAACLDKLEKENPDQLKLV